LFKRETHFKHVSVKEK